MRFSYKLVPLSAVVDAPTFALIEQLRARVAADYPDAEIPDIFTIKLAVLPAGFACRALST